MKTNRKKENKTKQQIQSKKIVIIGTIVVAIILIVVAVIINKQKEETQKHRGMEFKKEMNLSSVNLIESRDEEPEQVPVPKGYVASSVESEGTVKGGFVIYEGEEEVTEANLEEAKKTRNQFVWIPIEEASDMYYMLGQNMYGAYYTFSTTGYTRKTSTNEPSIVTNYDKDSTYLITYMNGITREKFLREMQQSFYEMIESVETYGGYYIGRYETGNLSKNEPVVVKMNTDIHSVNWYNMYKRSKRISGQNENVKTGMIWGIQFDETLKWLIDSGSKTNEEVATDSTSWGNYKNATFTYTNTSGGTSTKANNSITIIPTGSSEYTKANNIYDLAGNVWEWTMEGNGSIYRYSRGGGYGATGTDYPAHYRYYDNPYRSNNGRRLSCHTLYKVALSLADIIYE